MDDRVTASQWLQGRSDPSLAGRRRGTVLIVVLWIVLVLAGLVLVFARSARVEVLAAANQVAALQAAAVARAALQYIISQVDGTDGDMTALEEMASEAIQVGDGYFWLLRPSASSDGSWSFGLVDEASKLNVNTAGREVLARLPGLTAEIAASIVDWRDADNNLTEGGAESEYYLLLSPSYNCKNGPLETVEELLLIKGIDAELLYGEDANRNGVLDANENDGSTSEPSDNRDGKLDPGLAPFVTVYSWQPNASGGRHPVNVNEASTPALSRVFQGVISGSRLTTVLQAARTGRPFRNLLDFYIRTGLKPEEFNPVADQLTTQRDQTIKGLVNVNTAPREVLACLPGLEEDKDLEALLAKRADEQTDLSSIAWVAEALPAAKATELGDVITARSFQVSADIVAASGDGRAFKRYRVVIDAAVSPPRVLYWKELTDLGWPLSDEVLTAVRSGQMEEEFASP